MQEFVAHELEVLVSTVDAERTLQQLLEDRATLNSQLNELNNIIKDEKTSPEYREDAEKEIAQVKQELDLRNAQIADLQQKILDSDQENKSNTRWDVVQSMADAKAALKHVFNLAADIRREAILKDYSLKELQQNYENTNKKLRELEKEIRKIKEKHQEELLMLEREHQENLHCLLNNENKENIDQTRIFDRTLSSNELKALQSTEEELRKKEEECNSLKERITTILNAAKTPKNQNAKKRRSRHREFEDLDISADGSLIDDDPEKDPDWMHTPIHKKLMALKRSTMIPQFPDSRKRGSDGSFKCGCHSSCNTKRCVCFKMDGKCRDTCSCDPLKCQFKISSTEQVSSTNLNETFIKSDEASCEDFKKPRYTYTVPSV